MSQLEAYPPIGLEGASCAHAPLLREASQDAPLDLRLLDDVVDRHGLQLPNFHRRSRLALASSTLEVRSRDFAVHLDLGPAPMTEQLPHPLLWETLMLTALSSRPQKSKPVSLGLLRRALPQAVALLLFGCPPRPSRSRFGDQSSCLLVLLLVLPKV
jgi:hypothetical protein